MKRLVLYLSLIFASEVSFAGSRSIQCTVGVPFVIDPVLDDGTWPHNKLWKMIGPLNLNDSYSFVPTNFTYTTQSYSGTTFQGEPGVGYVYTITPTKAGLSSFKINMTFETNHVPYSGSEAYTFHAVDVISVSIPNISLTIGNFDILEPVIMDALATPTLTWRSSDPSIATVSNNGTVTAVGVGTATITCKAHNGVSGQSTVTVTPIYVESVTLNKGGEELSVGDKLQLEASFLPENASIKNVTWSSTNEAVAMVNETGLVYAIGTGACKITATANDGSGKTASCIVNVAKKTAQGDMNGDGELSVTDVVKLIHLILQQ